jgi:serine/threonine protein kinase/Flp pilus assembly protein TadD
MTTWNPRANDLFLKALELPSRGERHAYLERACAADAPLRAEVEALLEASARAGSFLEAPAADLAVTIDEHPVSEGPGAVIGPYKLLEQIGEGGFGVVFMAEQIQPVRRKVALKVLKPGMDSRQVIARFEAERQALALMDHPNIAHVFDGGETVGGRPYFVMELVKGIRITDYCDQDQLTPRERLELFVSVCQAVQHAHQKGIIHRDLKPSNVLVTLHDGTPVVKIIDFGIAKATGQQLTDKTLYTGFAQLIGTPLYMSPEQAALSGLDVDTRSDIYSLGVLLYELLTGTTPFDKERFREAGYDEMRRIIREEEPPRPSTRLSTLGPAATAITAQRKSDPRKLSQLCRGELDWIVMKCLEKDRARRYESASALARDIERYLHDEPVQACPPSMMYRFRKFARRNKAILATATLVSLALLSAVVVLALSYLRINDEKSQKDQALQQALANEKMADTQRRRAQANLVEARKAVDQMLIRVAEERLAYVPQMEQVRRKLLEDALEFYQKFLRQEGDDRAIRLESAVAYRHLASIYRLLGQHAKSEEHFRKAIAMWEQLAAESRLDANGQSERILTYIHYNWLLSTRHRHEEAEKGAQRAVQLCEQLLPELRESPKYRWLPLHSYLNLAEMVHVTRPEEAEKLIRRAIKLKTSQQDLADCYRNLARVLANAGPTRAQEARKACHEALAIFEKLAAEPQAPNELHDKIGDTLRTLGAVFVATGKMKEAAQAYSQAAESFEKVVATAPTVPGYREAAADAYNRLGQVLKSSGQAQGAEKAFRRALQLFTKLAADFPTSPQFQRYLVDHRLMLGRLLVAAGRPHEALELYGQAAKNPGKLGADLPGKLAYWRGLVQNQGELGRLLAASSRTKEAEAAYRQVLAIQKKLETEFSAKRDYRQDLAHSHMNAAHLLRDIGRKEDAAKLYRLALAHWNRLAADFPRETSHRANQIDTLLNLGHLLRGNRRHREAEQHYRRALGVGEKLAAECPKVAWYARYPAVCSYHLGDLFCESHRRKEATDVYRRALVLYEKLMTKFPTAPSLSGEFSPIQEVEKNLGALLAETGQGKSSEKTFGQAVRVFEKLVADFPKVPGHRGCLAIALEALSNAYHAAGRAPEARRAFRRALAVFAQPPAGLAGEYTWWETKGHTHRYLGFGFSEAGRHQEAIEAFGPAVEAFAKAAVLAPAAANSWHGQSDTLVQIGIHYSWLGRTPQADEAYRRALALCEKIEADGLFRGMSPDWQWGYLRNGAFLYLRRGQGYRQRGLHQKAQADYRRAITMATQSIEREAAPWDVWLNRGTVYAELGQWDKAGADFAKTIQLEPDQIVTHYWLALVRVGAGDLAGYRKACAPILQRFRKMAKQPAANLAAWGCALAPEAVADYPRLVRWAERVVADQPNDVACRTTLGAVLYRAGRFDEALKLLNEAQRAHKPADEQRITRAYIAYFLAMAHHRLGHHEEVRHWLDKATWQSEPKKPGQASGVSLAWNRRLTLQLLRREAEQLLQGKER